MSDYLTSGRLEDHPFADLAGRLFRESRSGELVLEGVQRRRAVWFLGGNPVAVVSDDAQDHLAQILLEHGKISAEEAQRLAGLPETREALGKAEFLSKETLNWGVKSRFVNLCYDLFRWEEGDYAFTDGEPPRDLIFLKVPAHSLVFKGVGFLPRTTVIDAVPDDAVCGAGPVAPADARYLVPEVREILDECRPGSTVTEVLEGRDDPDQDRRMLYALVCLGLVTLSHGPAAAEEPEPFAQEGFTLEDESDLGAAPETPEYPVEPGFDLPPLGSGPVTGENTAPEPEPGPSGGFLFDTETATGSFPSFEADLAPVPGDEPPAAADGDRKPGKSKARKAGRSLHLPRWVGIALGSVAAAAVLGVAGWWWMGGEPPPPPPKPPVKRPAQQPPATTPAAPVATAPVPPEPTTPAPTPAPAPTPSAPAPEPPPVATPAPAAPAPAAAKGGDRNRNALEIFKAGDFDAAAAVWESLLSEEHRSAYTLLLMTACQANTIRGAQQSFPAQQIYLITKKVNGRSCFRVCLDTFDSREAATRALTTLPAAYRSAGAAVRPVAEVLTRDR